MTRKLTPTERINMEAEAADRGPSWPTPLPHWIWPWMAWRDAGGIPKERPNTVPTRIPAWAWDRYKLHRGAKPVPPVSAFGGKGLFTGWDPGIVLRKRPQVDWIAVTTDLFTDEQGRRYPGCSPTMAAQLRSVGYRTHAWEARCEKGPQAATDLGCEGWIGQAESDGQANDCLIRADHSGHPLAVVGNPTAWAASQYASFRSLGFELILEHYRNEQPWLTPDSRGYPVSSYCFGCYPGAAGRVYLSDYLIELPTGSWSAYLAEELDDRDWETIGSKR